MDRAPTVVIIGQGSTRRLHKESHQNMDSIAMFKPISKWATTITRSGNIPEITRKAFKLAEAEKPGATVIELPEDVAKEKVTGAKPIKPMKTRRPGADHKAVAEAVKLIRKAKNPMIIAGNGAIRKRAAAQVQRLADLTGIGVVNTFMGKGAIPRDDQHCLFTIGLGAKDFIAHAIDECDVIISIGYDLVEYTPSLWNTKPGKKIVHIDFWPAEVDEAYPVAVDIQGDVADAIWQINESLEEQRAKKPDDFPLFDIKKTRAKLRSKIHTDLTRDKKSKSFPMKPQKILFDVREAMGPEDILLSDVGAHKMWISRYYQCDEPNTCLISNGFCSMGFALPGAMGAKIAHPDQNVMAICGDAGFLMNVQDIETAVREKINFVCMVWEDGEYGLIKWKQQAAFNGQHSELAFTNPNFELLAKAFGCWGKTITKPEQLIPAIKTGFKQPGPALISVPVDYRENMKLTKRLGDLDMHF